MNLQEFMKAGLAREIANRFRTEAQVRRLRQTIGYPESARPPFTSNGDMDAYWQEFFESVDAGILQTDDFTQVVDAALQEFQGNSLFRQYSSLAQATPSEQSAQPQQLDNIRQLFVEGPDGSRFEVTNIDPEILIKELAQGILSQYEDPKIFKDSRGRLRRTTVSRLNPDGSTDRLNSSRTLRDEGITNGSTVYVTPEATAGSLDQAYCEEARARARLQVKLYAKDHKGFQVEANAIHAPTEYLFKFPAPGFAPPLNRGELPQEINNHKVFLFLPGAFPMQAPEAYWQTPIFHPNVSPKNGYVCLGGLGEYYRPGLDFGEICQLLVDIASYRNYAAEEGFLNEDAHVWSETDEGKKAIAKQGGRIPESDEKEDGVLPAWENIKRLEL